MILTLSLVSVTYFFVTYFYALWRHDKIIARISSQLSDVNQFFVPILPCGRKVRAFTIDKSMLISVNTTVIMALPVYLMMCLKYYLGFNIHKSCQQFIAYALKLNDIKMMRTADHADYLVAVRNRVLREGRIFTAFSSGVAIHKYPETLPIFLIHIRNILLHNDLKRSHLIPGGVAPLIVLTLSLFVTYYMISALGDKHARSFSTQDELVLWSYLKDEVEKLGSEKVELLEIQHQLRGLIDEIVIKSGLKFRNAPSLQIAEDSSIGAYVYPSGKILLTSGLVQKLDSMNEAAFIISHVLWHYQNGDHLAHLGMKATNMRIYIDTLGANNFLGRILVWRSDFSSKHTVGQEVEADHFALIMLNKLYGSVFGYDIVNHEYMIDSHWADEHPITPDRIDSLMAAVQKGNKSSDARVPLKKLVKEGVKNDASTAQFTEQKLGTVDELVDEYNQDFYILLQDYYNHLTPYSKILEFDSRTDLHDLDYRLHLIAKSQEGVKAYKDLLNELETRYLQKIEALDLVELQHPTAKQKGRLWLSTINSTHQFFNQLMLHDVKTMEMQHVLLRFLYNRYASLSFTDQQIIFQTAKERDDYITLRTRIDKFSLSRPNFNQLSTRK